MIRAKLVTALLSIILIVGCSSSDDESMQWKKLPLPTSDEITGIYFPDDDLGYLVTAAGAILKTTDAGATFEVLDYKAGTRLEDTYFPSDDRGFVFGKDGFMARTTDGGKSWEQMNHDQSYWFYDMIFLDKKHGFTVGVLTSPQTDQVGFIGISTDNGETWSFDTTEYRGFTHIDILKENHVWVSGIGNIIFTTDRGETWQHNSTGNPVDFVRGTFFINIQHGWCVGNNGLLLSTDNGGWSWERRDKLTERNLTCLTAPEFNVIYLAGDGIIAGTKNHGRNWEIDSLTYRITFTDFFWEDDEVYLCGNEGTLLKLVK